eukprot:171753-Rhodomonas_salina.3
MEVEGGEGSGGEKRVANVNFWATWEHYVLCVLVPGVECPYGVGFMALRRCYALPGTDSAGFKAQGYLLAALYGFLRVWWWGTRREKLAQFVLQIHYGLLPHEKEDFYYWLGEVPVPILLRGCYAMSGTDLARMLLPGRSGWAVRYLRPMVLRVCYAVFGTDVVYGALLPGVFAAWNERHLIVMLGYGPIRCPRGPVLTSAMLVLPYAVMLLHTLYATCGTEVGYAATRLCSACSIFINTSALRADLVPPYAVAGTDLAYRGAVQRSGMADWWLWAALLGIASPLLRYTRATSCLAGNLVPGDTVVVLACATLAILRILVRQPICLRCCYAMPGTDIAYGAISLSTCYALPGTGMARTRYAVPGTDRAVRFCGAGIGVLRQSSALIVRDKELYDGMWNSVQVAPYASSVPHTA